MRNKRFTIMASPNGLLTAVIPGSEYYRLYKNRGWHELITIHRPLVAWNNLIDQAYQWAIRRYSL